MKKIISLKRPFAILFFLLLTMPAMAQLDEPDESEDGSNDPLNPSAPIDDYILPMLFVGAALGYYVIKKRKPFLSKT